MKMDAVKAQQKAHEELRDLAQEAKGIQRELCDAAIRFAEAEAKVEAARDRMSLADRRYLDMHRK
jgi:hypothetical protein